MSTTNQLMRSPYRYRWHELLGRYTVPQRIQIRKALAEEMGVVVRTVDNYLNCRADDDGYDIPTRHALYMVQRFGVTLDQVLNVKPKAQPFEADLFALQAMEPQPVHRGRSKSVRLGPPTQHRKVA